jgi:hypothetical protein
MIFAIAELIEFGLRSSGLEADDVRVTGARWGHARSSSDRVALITEPSKSRSNRSGR